MQKVRWTSSHRIGTAKIDDQHRQLTTLVNRLVDHIESASSQEHAAELLGEAMMFALTHFPDEEEVLQQIAHPDIDSHRAEHIRITGLITELCMSALSSAETVLSDLLEVLYSHWDEHVPAEVAELRRLVSYAPSDPL